MMEIREVGGRNKARAEKPDPPNRVESVVTPNLNALFVFIILLITYFIVMAQLFYTTIRKIRNIRTTLIYYE